MSSKAGPGDPTTASATWQALRVLARLLPIMFLAACQPKINLPAGAPAYDLMAQSTQQQLALPYAIGPTDILTIRVFGAPELSFEEIQIDASGKFEFPLIGEVDASGKTPTQLSGELASRLRVRYMVDPRVTVLVKEAAANTVTVLGAVKQPGVFKLRGSMTLLDAIALGGGLERVAEKKQVVVLRMVDGRRMGALFDVGAIQFGGAEDPVIRGDDTVVVGLNHLEAAWRDALLAAPLFAIFTPLYSN